MKIITGYKGEAHITSLQDRAANQGSYGTGSYVLDVGSKMTADIISANEIHINDGVLSHQGCVAIIEPGTYDSVEISNGMQGMNRIDRIVARYTKNAETNIENLELVVIEGTPSASTPSAPSYTTGQIQNGALVVDMPLYNVRLSGITISSVDKQFSTVRTQAELDSAVNALTGTFKSISNHQDKTSDMTSNNGWTATAYGIMNVLPSFDSSGSDAYEYVTDVTQNYIVCTISGKGDGLRRSASYPVIKNHVYKLTSTAHIGTHRMYFYSFDS